MSFEALDTLEGLGIVDFNQACTLRHAEAILKKLECELPSDVSELLLPRAREAIDALRAVSNGFFMSSHIKSGGIQLPSDTGKMTARSLEDASALYLRVLRNGHHGFTPSPKHEKRRRQILLSAHTGAVDPAIVFLPYLYWLYVLTHPECLRRVK